MFKKRLVVTITVKNSETILNTFPHDKIEVASDYAEQQLKKARQTIGGSGFAIALLEVSLRKSFIDNCSGAEISQVTDEDPMVLDVWCCDSR